MEVVDNLVMAAIPGAMDAGLVNPSFWIGMISALTAAFIVAFPVNRYLIDKGNGHADPSVHARRAARGAPGDKSRRTPAPSGGDLMNTNTLAAALAGFLLGGLVVSIAAELEDDEAAPPVRSAPGVQIMTR